MPNKDKERNYFVYNLGPAIIPSKEIKTGKIYATGRVWAMIDTLLTSETISEARDISKSRNVRIGKFSELTKFIPLLEHDSYGEWIRKSENTVPFVNYTPVVNNFIKSVLKFNVDHPEYDGKHYYDVLNKYGLWQTCPLEQIDVSKLDAKCMFSILICMLREEHFGSGDILEYLQNGAVIKWLNRLKELDY